MQVQTNNGRIVNIDDLAMTPVYDANGNLLTKTWTDGTWSWQQTFTYSGNTLATSSAVVRIV